MAKNMPVPNTSTLKVMKTIGTQSIFEFSWLLIGTICREVHCLKTLLQQLHRIQAIVESHIDGSWQMI